MDYLSDLPLLQRAATMLCAFSRRSTIRASAQRGTAQVLCWQSTVLCEASARVVTEAAQLVVRSRRSRNAEASTEMGLDLPRHRLTAERLGHDQEAELVNIAGLGWCLADIASRTSDPNTARRLMVLVNQLFTAAGLPGISPEPSVRH